MFKQLSYEILLEQLASTVTVSECRCNEQVVRINEALREVYTLRHKKSNAMLMHASFKCIAVGPSVRHEHKSNQVQYTLARKLASRSLIAVMHALQQRPTDHGHSSNRHATYAVYQHIVACSHTCQTCGRHGTSGQTSSLTT